MPPRESSRTGLDALAAAIRATGTPSHIERLIDLAIAIVWSDMATVTRYALKERPEFIAHRNFDDALVKRYLEHYYVYDPFFAHWRSETRPGVVPLSALAGPEVRRGRYVAEFLRQSVIADELGVLLDDGPGWCLGIFLDRRERRFTAADAARMEAWFPVLAALHARHRELAAPPPSRGFAPPPAEGKARAGLPAGLWPELSARERQIVELVLAGHPSASIAQRLGITTGTVKNHRRRIYARLDITTERELFLQYFEYVAGSR
jgi:DNA-binding CsgD family transcriptional regulator